MNLQQYRKRKMMLCQSGEILGQNFIRLLNNALNYFFKKFVLSKVVHIYYEHKGDLNQKCPFTVFF